MRSITKNRLSRDTIERLVERHFGPQWRVGSITELTGGFFNSAYRIENIEKTDKMVLKVSVSQGVQLLSYEGATMETEVEVYHLLSTQTTIPIPTLLASDFSHQVIDGNYFFMSALEGEIMNKVKLEKENADEIQRQLAKYFVQFHQIKGTYYGYFSEDPSRRFPTWKAAFSQMMGMILADGKAHRIRLPYDRYEKVMERVLPVLESVQSPVLINYDLHPGNIFLRKGEGGYEVEGIVDFERAFWGDPLADFPAAFLRIDDIRENPAFWNEYCQRMGHSPTLTREAEIRYAVYRLYIFTIMAVEVYRYGLIWATVQSTFAKSVAMRSLKKLEAFFEII